MRGRGRRRLYKILNIPPFLTAVVFYSVCYFFVTG